MVEDGAKRNSLTSESVVLGRSITVYNRVSFLLKDVPAPFPRPRVFRDYRRSLVLSCLVATLYFSVMQEDRHFMTH